MSRIIIVLLACAFIVIANGARHTPTAVAHLTGATHLSIDAKPYNGTAPCDPIDSSVNLELGDQFEVALCIDGSTFPPLNSALNGSNVTLTHGTELVAPNVSDDGILDVNANPDLNEGTDLGGNDWDCNSADMPSTAPSGNPALQMMCSTQDLADNVLPIHGGNSGNHLATVTLDAVSLGSPVISWDGPSNLSNTTGTYDCVSAMVCVGATINVVPPTELDAFHSSRYRITGNPTPYFSCGALVDETAGVLTGDVDCTTAIGGTLLNGTVITSTHPDTIAADIQFASGSVVHFSGWMETDHHGFGTWACTNICPDSGTYETRQVGAAGQECQSIGPTGGTFTNPFNGDFLSIPPGALSSTVNICGEMINLPASVGPGSNVLTRAYRFAPDGLTFNAPFTATLRVHYDQDEIVPGMTEANLGVYVYDTTQFRWERTSGTVTPASNYLEVQLEHFSDYGFFDCGSGMDTDASIDNGPGIVPIDASVPNSDGVLDLCDEDDDNDGIGDIKELVTTCTGGHSTATLHPNPGANDITNDDNADGNPAPPMGSDAGDDGPSWDTDNDGQLDGAECIIAPGSDPRSSGSKLTVAQCGGTDDDDNDGLAAGAETCKWGTSDGSLDSDGDGLKDCVEANDTNGDKVQNFPGDTINSAKAASGLIGKTMDFDLNGDGFVNFPGDTILSARMSNHIGGICP